MVRGGHGLVAVDGKLFAVGREDSCEVFDGNEFSLLKNPLNPIRCQEVLSVGSKVVIFQDFYSSSIVVYDVENDEWSEKPCDVAESTNFYSCVKIPFCNY